MATVIFNGKTYNSMEEMSANDRQAYEQIANMFVDKNGNGIPDFLEGDLVNNVMTAFTNSVNFNGQTYNGIDELPADVRMKVQGAFEKLSELGIVTKSTSPMMVQASSMQMEPKPQAFSKPFISQEFNPAIQEESGSNTMIFVLGGIALFFCVIISALAAFLLLMK